MTGAAPLGRDEADAAIVALVAAHDRISAAMWSLDRHPGAGIVRDARLAGHTLQRATELTASLHALWSQFSALNARLDEVRAVRGRRGRPGEDELRELTVLLRTPVVPVGSDGTVPDGPDQTVVVRLSLWDLARRVETTAAAVNAGLSELVAARSDVADRFGPALAAFDWLRAVAADLGPDGLPADRLDGLDARLTEAYGEASADPLAARSGGVGAAGAERLLRSLTAELATLRASADVLVALRDSYPGRAERLRAAVADLAVARRTTVEACVIAGEKIADPGLPAVPDAGPGLAAQAAQLDQLHRERRWSRLAGELVAAERAAEAALARLAEVRSAADGLVERRAELRGRLEAFRARAARLGLAEHVELSALGQRAEVLLWSAPCDLPAATRALAAYQRLLNVVSERRVERS